MGGGDVEEVTCTVIEGVAYNQMCQSVADFRTTEEESITGTAGTEYFSLCLHEQTID